MKKHSHLVLDLDSGDITGLALTSVDTLMPSGGENIDGGRADSIYLPTQNIDGGGA